MVLDISLPTSKDRTLFCAWNLTQIIMYSTSQQCTTRWSDWKLLAPYHMVVRLKACGTVPHGGQTESLWHRKHGRHRTWSSVRSKCTYSWSVETKFNFLLLLKITTADKSQVKQPCVPLHCFYKFVFPAPTNRKSTTLRCDPIVYIPLLAGWKCLQDVAGWRRQFKWWWRRWWW